jgi:hypothetical protein
MNEILKTILPAAITVILNTIFYLLIKHKVERSLEKQKIAYSGVFAEKIKIYRELLKMTYEAKSAISLFEYDGDEKKGKKIMKVLNNYNKYFRINEPFLSQVMLTSFKELHKAFQEIFGPMHLYYIGKSSQDKIEKFFNATNKLRANNIFIELESNIVSQMRSDLSTAHKNGYKTQLIKAFRGLCFKIRQIFKLVLKKKVKAKYKK